MLDEETAARLKPMKVLYVDDDEKLLLYMNIILDSFFDTVYLAKDGAEAISIYNLEKPNILILDNKMPKMNGLDVAREIRDKGDNVPIFFTTNYAEKDDLLLAVKLNLIDYILKPITVEKLEAALCSCLDKLYPSKRVRLSKDIFYDMQTKEVIKNDEIVLLTKKESQLLEFLISKKDGVATTEELEREIWNGTMTKDTLRNLVSRLRECSKFRVISNKCLKFYHSAFKFSFFAFLILDFFETSF
jgi:DNA-binding response OmpR family regulator